MFSNLGGPSVIVYGIRLEISLDTSITILNRRASNPHIQIFDKDQCWSRVFVLKISIIKFTMSKLFYFINFKQWSVWFIGLVLWVFTTSHTVPCPSSIHSALAWSVKVTLHNMKSVTQCVASYSAVYEGDPGAVGTVSLNRRISH